jgi:hypothetical protein
MYQLKNMQRMQVIKRHGVVRVFVQIPDTSKGKKLEK